MRLTIVLVFILLACGLSTPSYLYGQIESVEVIDQLTESIDRSSELSKTTFTANEIYQQVTDNGGEVIVLHDGKNIQKITREIGLSWGSLTTSFYFNDDLLMKIEETEKNYRRSDDGSSLDYTNPDQVFYWEYYVFDYNYDQGVINRNGDPVFSEPVCSLYEYEDEIERIRSYFLRLQSE